jgi:hypothetical protein
MMSDIPMNSPKDSGQVVIGMQPKLKGVLLISSIWLGVAAVSLCLAVAWMLVPGVRDALAGVLPSGSRAGLLLFANAILAGVLAYGLWTLKQWAYTLTIFVGIAGVAGGLSTFTRQFDPLLLLWSTLRVALFLAMVFYLWSAPVRAAFSKRLEGIDMSRWRR